MALQLSSPAFQPDGAIPKELACDGADLSAPLVWRDPPQGVRSFALIMDDPDAPRGTWVHWVLYDLPAETLQLPKGVPRRETLDDGAKQGRNDFGKTGYGGPCPPPGVVHRYFFKLYALDRKTGLPANATKQQLLDAMQGRILAEAQLMGTYKR